MSSGRPVVVAVDGGGSKTDAAVLDLATGEVLGRHKGPGCSHHALGIAAAVDVVDAAVTGALAEARLTPSDVVHAGCYLTAIDLDEERDAVHAALSALPWAGASVTVENDVFALLRAGTDRPDAAVVVCGTGFNGAAVRADGETARILALGHISGDWGGASGLAEEILWVAARAEDGRGEPTALREALLRWTGCGTVHDVVLAVHLGRLSPLSWMSRVPELLEIAAAGDAVALGLVERQGEEVGLLAGALLARLGLDQQRVPVVLGGGIGASGDERLVAAARRTLAQRAPYAELSVVSEPPITGAAALALADGRAPQH
ncbi:MAG: BadF/BadG/BcrA/BcrD ATPase family protein [Candidatus Nanopelagicales bacterium]